MQNLATKVTQDFHTESEGRKPSSIHLDTQDCRKKENCHFVAETRLDFGNHCLAKYVNSEHSPRFPPASSPHETEETH